LVKIDICNKWDKLFRKPMGRAMVLRALPTEVLSIEVEQRSILSDLRSGDFTKQRLACDRLSALAENHFPEFLPVAIALISDANRLDDRIRERLIAPAEQGVEIRQLIEATVNLLNRMSSAEPVGRIALDEVPAEGRPRLEMACTPNRLAAVGNGDFPSDPSRIVSENDDEEADLLRFIVQAHEPKSQGKLIVAQDITKAYAGSDFRLRPISLELNRGEILGIVGVNASGKTTLLRILLGELRQSHGELTYPSFEQGPKKRNWAKIKNRIAYVSQILPRWPGRIYDNLCYVASMYGHPLREIHTYLDLLLKRYGLDKYRNSRWDEISGGYKTRFEIVRALVSNPDILILDEPLAYLDIISQQIVLRQLRQLAKNRARPIGVIISSQQLYEIEAIADRLLVLEGGSTRFSGRVSELSRLIDDLAVEFSSTGDMMEIKRILAASLHYRSFFATETGYIAVFKRSAQVDGKGQQQIDFNAVVKILGRDCPGNLSYAREFRVRAECFSSLAWLSGSP
jgi:ABC-type multidrug transport system ATPase subunit